VASDAQLALSAGAFPPREGERTLNIEELGLSTAQKALGTRAVRPGNPVYLRVIDPDASKTSDIDQLYLTLQTSSGDEIRKLPAKETSPFSGEFEVIIPTTGAQAIAFASESAPGRDPNMAISAEDYPGWQGKIGDKGAARIFGVDLNDNVAAAEMSIQMEKNGRQGPVTRKTRHLGMAAPSSPPSRPIAADSLSMHLKDWSCRKTGIPNWRNYPHPQIANIGPLMYRTSR
jgi:hypothetical protein